MEFREYLKILKKNVLVILIFAIAGLFLSAVFVRNRPEGIRADQPFFLSVQREAVPNTLQYDGYYSQEKARNFTDTAVAILQSPEFTAPLPPKDATISVRKLAPQLIRLSATSTDTQDAKAALKTVMLTFNQKMGSISTDTQTVLLKEINQEPQIVSLKLNKKIILTAGFLIGIVFSLLVVGLKTYLKL